MENHRIYSRVSFVISAEMVMSDWLMFLLFGWRSEMGCSEKGGWRPVSQRVFIVRHWTLFQAGCVGSLHKHSLDTLESLAHHCFSGS